jgi:hypothetical protein
VIVPPTLNSGAERSGKYGPDPTRPASPKHRGAWTHGLAEEVRVHSTALVEAAISRLKRVIGNALRSRTELRRATEVAIAVHALNHMLELGRPKSVRIA